MQEEVRQIDTAPIDALLGIQAEQDQLKGLVAKAEETKGKVSDGVYRRVKSGAENLGDDLGRSLFHNAWRRLRRLFG